MSISDLCPIGQAGNLTQAWGQLLSQTEYEIQVDLRSHGVVTPGWLCGLRSREREKRTQRRGPAQSQGREGLASSPALPGKGWPFLPDPAVPMTLGSRRRPWSSQQNSLPFVLPPAQAGFCSLQLKS